MTKSELIRYLRTYSDAANNCSIYGREISETRDTIESLQKKPKLSKVKFEEYIESIFWIVVFSGIAWFVFGSLLASIFDYLGPVIGILLAFASFIFVSILWRNHHNRKYIKEYKIALEKYQKGLSNLPILEKQLQEKLPKLQQAQQRMATLKRQNILPAKYSGGAMAFQFMEYLQDGRADTLKEAINLYEMESRQDALYEENRRHNQEMEYQQQRQNEIAAATQAEASRAADAAEDAARSADFWGAVNAFQMEELLHKK